jgi:hypothetical protein
MAYMITTDVARLLLAGQKEIFMENFNSYPTEYTQFVTIKTSNKQKETYDSVGNLKAAAKKTEGGPIEYGKVTQGYQTTIQNYTWANGYEVTIEAVKYDLYGCVNSIKAKELARTMRELEEANAIYWYDNATAVNLADGVPLASDSKPLIDAVGVFNDTYAGASSIADPDNHMAALNLFYDFKNHAGGPMKSTPKTGFTHYANQFTVEEVYNSVNKAQEMSNTKNVLPKINWGYSTYISSKTKWILRDTNFDHVVFQKFMDTVFENDQDKIYTKNQYFNAYAIYNTGALPNIGIVVNNGA